MLASEERLIRYVVEYSRNAWGRPAPEITPSDLLVMEVRADGYANAHVEGEHEALGLCHADSAQECGERMAASEFVECN